MGQNYVGCQCNQLRRVFANALGITAAPTGLDPHVTAIVPAQFLQFLLERRHPRLCLGIIGRRSNEQADARNLVGGLPAHCKRPSGSRAAKKGNDLAPFHSMTSSARASSGTGIVMPKVLAVLRLMANLIRA